VLRHQTSCVVDSGSTYTEDGVTCTDHYVGRVTVDTVTFAQQATGTTTFTLAWPDVTVTTEVRMVLDATADAFDITLELDCLEAETVVAQRRWSRQIPRRLG
jgi:hypothetical protein